MAGVKNLLAMFEQKGENSPPDRGRSPGPGSSSAGANTPTPSQSPRPLSKVRASFVAVTDKEGRMGLRRNPSEDSASASSTRRLSNETKSTTSSALPEKNDVFAENMTKNAASFKTNLATEPIPESPIQDFSARFSPHKEVKTPEITSNLNPEKITDEESKAKLTAGDPTSKKAVNGSANATNGTHAANEKAKTATSISKSTAKAALISTTAKTTKTTKSPAASLKSPAALKSQAPAARKETVKSPGPASEKKATIAKSSISSSKKPGALDVPLPASPGFVKPKPKSPTRPVKLPPSLTTHTASSASRSGNTPPRQSLSRASGNVGGRPSSRVCNATTVSKSLKRQNSTVNRPRPSFGPPPKQPARDHPVLKEAHVDESFLARMMRPTASSANKTNDKPLTPPRKSVTPTPGRSPKPIGKDAHAGAKKATARLADKVGQTTAIKNSGAAKVQTKAGTAAKPKASEIAPVVAQAESAEEAIEAAYASKETAFTPVVEEQDKEVAAPTPATEAGVTEEPVVETIAAPVEKPIEASEPAEEKLSEAQSDHKFTEVIKEDNADTEKPASPSMLDGTNDEDKVADA